MKQLITAVTGLALIGAFGSGSLGCEKRKAEEAGEVGPAGPASKTKEQPVTTPASPMADTTEKNVPAGAPDQSAAPQGPMTVSKLQDSFRAEKGKWLGRQVMVDGLYLNTHRTASPDGGPPAFDIVVVEEKGRLQPSLLCFTKEEPKGLMQYDPVRVKGTVAAGNGAELRDCTVQKQ